MLIYCGRKILLIGWWLVVCGDLLREKSTLATKRVNIYPKMDKNFINPISRTAVAQLRAPRAVQNAELEPTARPTPTRGPMQPTFPEWPTGIVSTPRVQIKRICAEHTVLPSLTSSPI